MRFRDARIINSNSPRFLEEHIDPNRPVTANQISGFLHVLCGLAPVPSRKRTVLERCPDVQRIVDWTWIRYDRIPTRNELETIQTGKHKYNSHLQIHTWFGDEKKNGYYTWNYFERFYYGRPEEEKKTYRDAMHMLKNLCGDDICKRPFPEFAVDFRKRYGNSHEVSEFVATHNKLSPFLCFLFGIDITTTNCNYTSRTPLLLKNGIGVSMSYSGELIVMIDDERILERIRSAGTTPRILDGGVVNIVSCTNELPYSPTLIMREFERFKSEDCSLIY